VIHGLRRCVVATLAMLCLVGDRCGSAWAQVGRGMTPVGNRSISRNAAALMPDIDRRAALSGLEPLRKKTLAADDLEVRIWCGRASRQSDSYVFRRIGGIWSGIDLFPVRPETAVVHFQMPLTEPGVGWEGIWKELQADGILTLPDHYPHREGRRPSLNDGKAGAVYVVELNVGGAYRAYTYLIPFPSNNASDAKMETLVEAADKAFRYSDTGYNLASLRPEAERHLLTDNFQEFHDVRKIPDWVRQTLIAAGWPPNALMANPGAEWQVGDVVRKEGLPWTRLLFVALRGDYCVLAYERGGIGHSYGAIFLHRNTSGKFAATIEGSTSLGGLTQANIESVRALQRDNNAFRVTKYLP